MLPPLHSEKSPGLACLLGFLFGGIGLAIYLRSFVDFVLPVTVGILLFTMTSIAEVGWLAGACIAGTYGYMRVLHSNRLLSQSRAQS